MCALALGTYGLQSRLVGGVADGSEAAGRLSRRTAVAYEDRIQKSFVPNSAFTLSRSKKPNSSHETPPRARLCRNCPVDLYVPNRVLHPYFT